MVKIQEASVYLNFSSPRLFVEAHHHSISCYSVKGGQRYRSPLRKKKKNQYTVRKIAQ